MSLAFAAQPVTASRDARRCAIRSAHGSTIMVRRRDGVLCHRGSGDPADYAELVAYLPAGSPGVCFFVASGDVLIDLSMAGEAAGGAVLSYELVGPDPAGSFSFRHPLTGCYLTAAPQIEPDDGFLTIECAKVGGWELFGLSDSNRPLQEAAAAALSRIGWDSSGNPHINDVIAVQQRGEAASSAMVAALCRVMPTGDLRRLVPALVTSTSYARLFPTVQKRLRGSHPAFQFNSRTLMADGIRDHGWDIGEHSYGAPEIIDFDYGTLRIGRFCSIAGQVQVIVANHTTRTSTTYPFTALRHWWPNASPDVGDHDPAHVDIGHAVWIGTRACILPGTRVGHGSIIGAHAVARGDIPPFSVVVGNPGRVVRRLFDDGTIARMLAVAWWDWPDERVDRFIPLLTSPDIHAFLDAAEAELGIVATAG